MADEENTDWTSIEGTPFENSYGVLGFSATAGWTATNPADPDDGDSIPLLALSLGCVTPEQREQGIIVDHPEQFTYLRFMLYTHVAAEVIAGMISAAMKVDPHFMNTVVGCLVSQAMGYQESQVEGLLREVGAYLPPEGGDGTPENIGD